MTDRAAVRAGWTGLELTAIGSLRWLYLPALTLLGTAIVLHAGRHHGGGSSAAMMAAICLASFASSIAGFAFSAICGAMLFHISDDPIQVVQLMITCSIANQAAMTWSLRQSIDWGALALYCAGGFAGLPIGVWILVHADHAVYTHLIGGLLLAYGAYMLLRKPVVLSMNNPALDFAIGWLGGLTGGALGFPSGSVTVWCNLRGWDKLRQRALVQPFILIMQIAGLGMITWASHSNGRVGYDDVSLLFIPAGLLGTALGMGLFRRLSDSQFARAVNVLLMMAGASFVFR